MQAPRKYWPKSGKWFCTGYVEKNTVALCNLCSPRKNVDHHRIRSCRKKSNVESLLFYIDPAWLSRDHSEGVSSHSGYKNHCPFAVSLYSQVSLAWAQETRTVAWWVNIFFITQFIGVGTLTYALMLLHEPCRIIKLIFQCVLLNYWIILLLSVFIADQLQVLRDLVRPSVR